MKEFYDIPYYTHRDLEEPSRSGNSGAGVLDKLRVHLAWRVDRGRHFEARELGQAKGRSVCDIGCGDGNNLKALRHAGFRVVGIEPDPHARLFASQVATVFDGTAEQLPAEIETQSFSFVLLSHVLEHCIDPVAAIRNARSLLEQGGQLVIEVPNNAASGFDIFKACWPWSDIPRHINFFSERSLVELLDHCGLDTLSVHYVGYTRQFMPEWVAIQHKIWDTIGTGSRPQFSSATWKLLAETAFVSASKKYDTVRVHAKIRNDEIGQ